METVLTVFYFVLLHLYNLNIMTAQEFLQIATDSISNDPLTRIPQGMKTAIDQSNVLFDCHAHAFNWRDIPEDFMQKRYLKKIGLIRDVFNYWKNLDILPGLVFGGTRRLVERLKEERIALLKDLKNKYESSGFHPVFSLLMMDMRAVSGSREDDFETYRDSQIAIKNQFPNNVLLFFSIDPSNSKLYEQFLEAFKPGGDFFGVKVYPSLGYLPSHPKLMPIFRICEEKNIPITSHCSSAATRSSLREIKLIGLDNLTFQPFTRTEKFSSSPGKYKSVFNNPQNWIPVLAHHPTLSLNLAHFGGGDEFEKYFSTLRTIPQTADPDERLKLRTWISDKSWVYKILTMISKYPNVFADISYLVYEDAMIPEIRECLDTISFTQSRVLYGTDYPLSETNSKFSAQFDDIVHKLGSHPAWANLIRHNAKHYLFRKNAPSIPPIIPQP